MQQYKDYIQHIFERGVQKGDRTGTGTLSTFGYQARFDLKKGFPLLTTKKVHLKSVIHELLWFLSGDTNVKYLQDNGVTIWDEWAAEDGELGPVYGAMWRDFHGVDQIKEVAERLQSHPDCRRLIVNAWDASKLPEQALPPCHRSFQLWTRELENGKRELSLQVDQRSCDSGLGVPFNWASYALLTHMFAHSSGMEVGELIWNGGDCHIYLDHIEPIKEQMKRNPRPLPQLLIKDRAQGIFDYEYDDFDVVHYDPHPHIKMAVSA